MIRLLVVSLLLHPPGLFKILEGEFSCLIKSYDNFLSLVELFEQLLINGLKIWMLLLYNTFDRIPVIFMHPKTGTNRGRDSIERNSNYD
jgi:hypothetical protein